MSAEQIEQQLEEYLAHSDYEVRFRGAEDYAWFTMYVLYRGDVIYRKAVLKSYPRAARRAKRKVKSHAKALGILGPLVRQPEPSRERSAT